MNNGFFYFYKNFNLNRVNFCILYFALSEVFYVRFLNFVIEKCVVKRRGRFVY